MAEIPAQILSEYAAANERKPWRGATDSELETAQRQMGINFSPSHIQFLKRLNGGWCFGLRFLGVNQPVMEAEGFQTITDFRQAVSDSGKYIPEVAVTKVLPFANDWGGDWYCCDLTQVDEYGEYPILQWQHEMTEEPDLVDLRWVVRSPNFAEFVQSLFQQERRNDLQAA